MASQFSKNNYIKNFRLNSYKVAFIYSIRSKIHFHSKCNATRKKLEISGSFEIFFSKLLSITMNSVGLQTASAGHVDAAVLANITCKPTP